MYQRVLLSTSSYSYLRDQVLQAAKAKKVQFADVKQRLQTFPDGELGISLSEKDVVGKEVVILGGTPRATDLFELIATISAVVMRGAERVQVVVPFFGCQTQEKEGKQDEVPLAMVCADMLSRGIRHAPGGTLLHLYDLHSEAIWGFFDDPVRAKHRYCEELHLERIAAIKREQGDVVLLGTDEGRMKWLKSFAIMSDLPVAFVLKDRKGGASVERWGINKTALNGKIGIMFDDMIRTGSSMIAAAEGYLELGCTGIFVLSTHAVLPDRAIDRLREFRVAGTQAFRKVVVTDSHPRAIELAQRSDLKDFFEVMPMAELVLRDIA